MLLKVLDDGTYKNMHVSDFPDMTLFHTSLVDDIYIEVSYRASDPPLVQPNASTQTSIRVPLEPEYVHLDMTEIVMHSSKTTAYIMPAPYNRWFSECFGYPVILAYLGPNLRDVLGNVSPEGPSNAWLSMLNTYLAGAKTKGITFSDCAPLLVTTEASLEDLHARLAGDEKMDMTKFRPNIVLDGEDKWDEDFWAELSIGERKILLTANCVRCQSINIDYATGRPGKGESGTMLKKMMKDRRVDKGVKFSPVFGRYAFLERGSEGPIGIGDEVVVSKRNAERTVFGEFSLSLGTT
jgi:uncharacterized protein YcbX